MNNDRLRFLKSFLGFSLSAWVNAGLSLISTPLITRFFRPAEIGKINIFITVVNLILSLAYLGIDQAFLRFYHEPPGKNSKNSLLGLCLIMTCLVLTIISGFIFIYGDVLSATVLGYVTYIVPVSLSISIFANVIMRYANYYAKMQNNIFLFNLQTICITVISNISYIAVVIYKANAENAIVFRTLLTGVAGIVFFLYIQKIVDFKRIYADKKTIRTILLYALPTCPAAILAVANNSIGQLLMKHYVSYEMVGIYSNAVTVASIITLIQNGVYHYWEPLIFENYKTGQKQIMKMHHMISFVMIIFALGIIFCQDLIYTILVGKNFWASKQIFPLMIISPVCYAISETLGAGIKLSKKTFLNIPVYAVNLIVNVGMCLILLPKIGVVGAAMASAVSSMLMLLVKSVLGERLYRCSDNYFKLIIGLTILVAIASIHVFVYESPFKYIVYLGAVMVVCLTYMREIKSILGLLNDLKVRFIKKT